LELHEKKYTRQYARVRHQFLNSIGRAIQEELTCTYPDYEHLFWELDGTKDILPFETMTYEEVEEIEGEQKAYITLTDTRNGNE
jgi:hypothetical protein